MSCRQWAGYLEAGGAHGDGGVGQERAEVLPLQGRRPALDEDVATAHGAQHRPAHHDRHELRAALLQGGRAGSTGHQSPHSVTATGSFGSEFGRVARVGPGASPGRACSPLAISGHNKPPNRTSRSVYSEDLTPPSQQAPLASAAPHSRGHPYLKAQLCCEWVISHGVHGLVQSQSLGIWRGLVKDRT